MTSARSAADLLNSQTPIQILMTVDAVGGVWRYAMDLGRALRPLGVETNYLGFGPRPSPAMAAEAAAIGQIDWCNAALDWMAAGEAELDAIPQILENHVGRRGIDLLHLNLPSQARGLDIGIPVISVSHSCVTTWFDTVRRTKIPDDWRWQERCNLDGLRASDLVLAPSRSHAEAIARCYGFDAVQVVANSCRDLPFTAERADFVFAAGRWWDEGKNGAVLDQAASLCAWPVVMAGATRGPNGQEATIRHAEHRGTLDHSETMALMATAGIFVSPSIYEPFGLAALEAARSGAALVLSDIPTYRELWDGAALFADPHDPGAFAQAIDRLASDADLRRELGDRARQRSGDFTAARQAAAMLDIYRSLLLPRLSTLSAAE